MFLRTPVSEPKKEGLNTTVTISKSPGKEESPKVDKDRVRRSIDLIEFATNNQRRLSRSPTPEAEPKETGAKPKKKASSCPPVEAIEAPPTKSKKRLSPKVREAQACLEKALSELDQSRNLKTEIKTGVTEAVQRLFQLVKELDLANRQCTSLKTAQTKRNIESPSVSLATLVDLEEENRIRRETDLEELIGKHAELLRENNERMERLKEALEKKTYASAVTGTPQKRHPARNVLHSVVVTGKDESETGDEVLKRVRTTIDAKEGGVNVERVRKAKDRKVIIGCRTEEERSKLKERLSKAPELNVEEIKNKDPLVVLKNVLQINSDEDVLKALKNQNKSVFRDIESQDLKLEIAYKRRTRNPHMSHIVLRVSAKVWQRMLAAEAVHVDLQRVRVEDQSPLVQCSMCLGYGHGRRFCTEKIPKCSHCGGPHLKDKCEQWLAGSLPTCCNCLHAKLENTDHNAFSSACPVRRKWDALARTSIAYC